MSTNFSWGGGALAFALVMLCLRLLAPNVFWYVYAPAFHTADVLTEKVHAFTSSFEDTARLASQKEELANKNAILTVENQTLLQKANDLSALLGAPASKHGFSGVSAGVIARPPESPYDTLVIAAGSEEGISVGQETFGEGSVPLGVVEAVQSHFARIKLFSAPGVVTNGWVGDKSLPLSIFGAGGGALEASATRTAGISVGDMVYVPGPGKLPIGIVTRIDGNPSFPQITLRITPLLNIFSTTWVEVRDTGATSFGLLLHATSTLP